MKYGYWRGFWFLGNTWLGRYLRTVTEYWWKRTQYLEQKESGKDND